jgi:hypothetical protein
LEELSEEIEEEIQLQKSLGQKEIILCHEIVTLL